jgi:signal transduction histidine kinase
LLALNKSEIELTCHTSHPDKDYQIETDIIRLRQILNNLIYNAIKFTEKGSIEFGYYIKNKVIVFYVKDTGLGISSKKQKIIFERFRQEDEGHSRSYTGSGLGLTICRSLLELMEGEIWLNSQKGKGSVFYFSLPLTN